MCFLNKPHLSEIHAKRVSTKQGLTVLQVCFRSTNALLYQILRTYLYLYAYLNCSKQTHQQRVQLMAYGKQGTNQPPPPSHHKATTTLVLRKTICFLLSILMPAYFLHCSQQMTPKISATSSNIFSNFPFILLDSELGGFVCVVQYTTIAIIQILYTERKCQKQRNCAKSRISLVHCSSYSQKLPKLVGAKKCYVLGPLRQTWPNMTIWLSNHLLLMTDFFA